MAKDPGSLSSDTLKDFTEGLAEVDRVVVEAILSRQENVLDNVELRDLVTEYFGASLQTLEFLNELEHCLRVLDLSHTYLVIAIKKYENNKKDACLESLKKFKANGDPFKDKFYPMFEKLHERQKALLDKVQKMHDEMVERSKAAKSSSSSWWGDLFGIVAAAATVVTAICTAVAVVFPPAGVVAGVAAGVGIVAGLASNILKAKTQEEKLKNQEELTRTILACTTCVVQELETIKLLADGLTQQIQSLDDNADIAILDTDALELIMGPVKTQAKVFREDISRLTVHARQCKEAIFDGRNKVVALIRKFT